MNERSVADCLKSGLHEHFDAVLREPMPQRLVDLIHKLNERERQHAIQRERKTDRP
jgi:hypothetical protein